MTVFTKLPAESVPLQPWVALAAVYLAGPSSQCVTTILICQRGISLGEFAQALGEPDFGDDLAIWAQLCIFLPSPPPSGWLFSLLDK